LAEKKPRCVVSSGRFINTLVIFQRSETYTSFLTNKQEGFHQKDFAAERPTSTDKTDVEGVSERTGIVSRCAACMTSPLAFVVQH